jgi:hypothetical protein
VMDIPLFPIASCHNKAIINTIIYTDVSWYNGTFVSLGEVSRGKVVQ